MLIPRITTTHTILLSWWETLKSDRWVQALAILYTASALVHGFALLPANNVFEWIYYPAGLTLVLLALRSGLSKIEAASERAFWNDLSVAFGAWLVVETVLLFSSTADSFAVDLFADVFYGIFFTACVFALERRPHRGDSSYASGFRRRLRWPAVVTLVIGLEVYFILITAATNQLPP